MRELERGAFHTGINRSFAISRSHYVKSINLEVMSQGYMPGYEDEELEKMEDNMALLS
jgi:hypothetical protein